MTHNRHLNVSDVWCVPLFFCFLCSIIDIFLFFPCHSMQYIVFSSYMHSPYKWSIKFLGYYLWHHTDVSFCALIKNHVTNDIDWLIDWLIDQDVLFQCLDTIGVYCVLQSETSDLSHNIQIPISVALMKPGIHCVKDDMCSLLLSKV